MVGRADYYERQEARRDRLEARAEKLRREADARSKAGWDALHAIPFGQPILVGHHSEKRDRAYRAKATGNIDKSVMLNREAGEAEAIAANIGNGGISSDAPDAIARLRERIAELEARQARMKAANKAHAAWIKDAGGKRATELMAALSEADQYLVKTYKPAYSWEPHPFAPYQFQNLGANIRRLKDRLAGLEKAAQREPAELLHNSGVRLVQNVEANRVQLVFPGKPDAAVRSLLKGRGFRWSPTEGAWQRMLNNAGIWAAKQILEELAK